MGERRRLRAISPAPTIKTTIGAGSHRSLPCVAHGRRSVAYHRVVLRPTYPLLTPRLSFRPFRDDDLDAFHDLQRRPDVVRYLYWGPRSRGETNEMLRRRKLQVAIEREGDAIHLAADLRSTGQFIGQFNLVLVSAVHRQGEVGFVVHPDHHGHGYGAEGARLMLQLGFEELGLHRIVGRCDARNAASAGLMERLGMRREAHLVENEFVKGEWTDELDYAILDREWRAINAPG